MKLETPFSDFQDCQVIASLTREFSKDRDRKWGSKCWFRLHKIHLRAGEIVAGIDVEIELLCSTILFDLL